MLHMFLFLISCIFTPCFCRPKFQGEMIYHVSLLANIGLQKFSDLSHSLERKREILQIDGCFPKAPNIYHTFSHGDVAWAASKWWENHLPYLHLMQSRNSLRWFHMWDYDPPPYVQFSVFKHIVLIPYLDNVLVILWGCMGKEGRMACASWDGYSPYTLCFIFQREHGENHVCFI